MAERPPTVWSAAALGRSRSDARKLDAELLLERDDRVLCEPLGQLLAVDVLAQLDAEPGFQLALFGGQAGAPQGHQPSNRVGVQDLDRVDDLRLAGVPVPLAVVRLADTANQNSIGARDVPPGGACACNGLLTRFDQPPDGGELGGEVDAGLLRAAASAQQPLEYVHVIPHPSLHDGKIVIK